MSDKLKPCPFCGGEARLYSDGVHGFFHMCMIDGDAMVKIESRLFSSDEEAIEMWNRRSEPKSGRWVETIVRGSTALVCSCCEQESGVLYRYDYCPRCGAEMG